MDVNVAKIVLFPPDKAILSSHRRPLDGPQKTSSLRQPQAPAGGLTGAAAGLAPLS